MRSKGEVRREYLIRRRNIESKAREAAETAIRECVVAMPEIAAASCVLSYVSTAPEVDSRRIIDVLIRQGKRILAPVMTVDDDGMRWGEVSAIDALVHGPYGMSQPSADLLALVPAEAPVLVPLVAFTAAGERLGRGGGHFDRFLAEHGGRKIGLGYECQRAESLPVEHHDARLDRVVTEARIYEVEARS